MKLTTVSLVALLVLAVERGKSTLTNDTNLSHRQGSQTAHKVPSPKKTWEDDYAKLPLRGKFFLDCFQYESAVTSHRRKPDKKNKKCKELIADAVNVTHTDKKVSCGGTYQVNEGAAVVVKLPSSSPTCDVLLTAGRNAELDVRCPRFRLGPRQEELLYLTPGRILGWVYDLRRNPGKMGGEKQLYLLYTRRRESVPQKSSVTCHVAATDSKPGSEETGRPSRAKGRQIKGCSTKCGVSVISMRDVRIVGGTLAAKGEIPWMVHLQVKTANEKYVGLCGGSILTDTLILTAAHCLHKAVSVTVYACMHDRREILNNETQVIPVQKMIVHPLYEDRRKMHDIALLVLEKKIQWKSHLRPVCLAPRSVVQVGELAVVSGWGGTEPIMKKRPRGIDGSSVLLKTTLAIVPQSDCMNMYPGLITKYQICSGAPGKDSCQGDSGGPLVVRDKNLWYQAGVVSTGHGCADPNYSGINTRVSEYTDWILSHATGSC